ncbi:hypothetical protein [Ruegeria sp. PrR005]|uniref:Uncharacterized protein n=1 Tax=Ruegeria sp. PrR005 TaxID=2706882 RepID=A0A6B2NLX0_9RHOB|nr:hypothetical protein [Ruegeria sp. PrR005]NDW45101.1 hypothetical protein [Ruegeria sp. PrR005]
MTGQISDVTVSEEAIAAGLGDTITKGTNASGDDWLQEAFVIYRPTGQIMRALVDGEGQSAKTSRSGGEFDLLNM